MSHEVDGVVEEVNAALQTDRRVHIVALNSRQRVHVVGVAPDGIVYDKWQSEPNGRTWTPWEFVGGNLKTIQLDHEGLAGLGVWADGSLFENLQALDSHGQLRWGRWVNLETTVKVGQIAVVRNRDRRMEVFGIGQDSALYNLWHIKPDKNNWAPWWNYLGGSVQQIGVASNGDGRLEVFGIGRDNALWHTWQPAAGQGPWSAWHSLGGQVKQIAVKSNYDGRLEVFGIGPDDTLWSTWQTAPGSGEWYAWRRIGGPLLRQITTVGYKPALVDNALDVFGIGLDNLVYHAWQDGVSMSWHGLGDGQVKQIAVSQSWDGPLEVFGTGLNDLVYNNHEVTHRSNQWSGWNVI